MPWDSKAFKARHNKKLTDAQAGKAAAQANALLKKGMSEGEAIAIANKTAAKKRKKPWEGMYK